MARLTKLTPEQEARLPEWIDRWVAIGLSTEPADWDAARRGIDAEYRMAGLEPPKIMIRAASPLAAFLSVGALRNQVGDQVGRQVLSQVDSQVDVWAHIGGQFWAAFPAYTSFFREVCGLDIPDAREITTRSCGWWYPLDGAVVVSDRPDRIVRDDAGQLHSETGPAMRWRDGWSIYAWHGTQIPGEWIEQRDTLDPMIALTHENVEQRRCAAEIIGWPKVLQHLNPKILDTDIDPQIGTLLQVDLPDHGPQKFLRVLEQRSGREFALYAPEEAKTALEAQSLINRIPAELFRGGYLRT